MIGKNRRRFTLNQIILLYAFVIYRQNLVIVSENDFRRRLRILNNLILNSSDQISDSEERQGGNRLPAILRQVDSIILQGQIASSETIGINFNPSQIEEERMKLEWTNDHTDQAELLFTLEDHELLYGQISIVGLEHPEHFQRFKSLFSCNWDLVDRALLTLGDYKQKERNGWRYQLGSSMDDGFAWKTLFHKSENLSGYDDTKKVLNMLLSKTSEFTDDFLTGLVSCYLMDCERNRHYSWIYYYIKYKEFRNGRYGKYWWDDFENKPYEVTTIHQRQKPSTNSYNPFLKAVNEDVWSEYLGKRIYLNDKEYLKETQSSYQVVSAGDEVVIEEFKIAQDNNYIDTENRIEKMKIIYCTLKE